MVIQLVSFKSSLRADSKLRHTAEIINSSAADLILFPGHSLDYDTEALLLADYIENKKTCALLEVKNDNSSLINPMYNSLYLLKQGILKSMFTSQLFTDTNDINACPGLAEHLILDLETRRKFSVANRKVLVLQCGENGILRNIQSENNRVEFRFPNLPRLLKRFENVIEKADIILNPMHSPMGNQGKISKRREYFSANNRAYFSTANFDDAKSMMNKSLQYACINGIEQEAVSVNVNKRGVYISRTFII